MTNEVYIGRSIDLSGMKRSVVRAFNKSAERITRKTRRHIVGIARKNFSANCPEWAQKFFIGEDSLKSEVRTPGAGKAGGGMYLRTEHGEITVSFYANDKSYPIGSDKYGWNQFYAIANALYGRRGFEAEPGETLVISTTSPRYRWSGGYTNPLYTKSVKPVTVDKSWLDRAMDGIEEDVANGRW